MAGSVSRVDTRAAGWVSRGTGKGRLPLLLGGVLLSASLLAGCFGGGDPGRLLLLDDGDFFITTEGEDAGFDARVLRADWTESLATRVDGRWNWQSAATWEDGFLVVVNVDDRTRVLHLVDPEERPTTLFESQYPTTVRVLPGEGLVVVHESAETQRCYVGRGIEEPQRVVRADACGLVEEADGLYAIDQSGGSLELGFFDLDGDERTDGIRVDGTLSRVVTADGLVGLALRDDYAINAFVVFDAATGDRVTEIEGTSIGLPYSSDMRDEGFVAAVDHGHGAVELVAVDGSGQRTLTESAAGSGVVAADGRTTVWIADTSASDRSRVVDMSDADGIELLDSSIDRVVVLGDQSGTLVWETDRDERVLWLDPSDGDDARRLAVLDAGTYWSSEASFGEDKPLVVTTHDGEGGSGLLVVARDGTVVAELASNRWHELRVLGLVDDRLVLRGQEEPDDPFVLASLALDGSEGQPRRLDRGDAVDGTLHHVGSMLVYSVLDRGDWTVRKVEVDGGDPEVISRGGALVTAEADLAPTGVGGRSLPSMTVARTDTAAALCGAAGLTAASEAVVRIGQDGEGLGCLDVAGHNGEVLVQVDGLDGWADILDSDLSSLWSGGPTEAALQLAAVWPGSDLLAFAVQGGDPGSTVTARVRAALDGSFDWGALPSLAVTPASGVPGARSVYGDDYAAQITGVVADPAGAVELDIVAAGPDDLLGPWGSCLVSPSGSTYYSADSRMDVEEPGRYEGTLWFELDELGDYEFQYACRSYTLVPAVTVEIPYVAMSTGPWGSTVVTAALRDDDLVGLEVVEFPGYGEGARAACLSGPDGRSLPLVSAEPLDVEGSTAARFVFAGGTGDGTYTFDYGCAGDALAVDVR
jgi:hypothetical protein